MKIESFQDTALLFSNSISTFLRIDEEFRKAWRYKHRQEALKPSRREALKNARAWAEKVREHLEIHPETSTIERYTGKTWQSWVDFMTARDEYLENRSEANLNTLKTSEATLKQNLRAINALLQ